MPLDMKDRNIKTTLNINKKKADNIPKTSVLFSVGTLLQVSHIKPQK